jgi:hypothetical protein
MTKQNDDKDKDLIIAVLKQRLGELVSAYEHQVASIRVEFTNLKNEYEHLLKVLADDAEAAKNAPKKG